MKKKIILVLCASMLFTVTLLGLDRDRSLLLDEDSLFKNVQIFADAITLIGTEYVKSVELKDLVHGAIKGMMDSLDGYSQFMDADSFRKITVETEGEFGGIGIRIGIRDGVLTVIAPLEGTPADKKGVKAADKIVKIGDEVTRDMTLDDAVDLLRGEPGTEVEITFFREKEERVIELSIERAIIKVDSVREEELIEGDIGYIRLAEFQKHTPYDFEAAVKSLVEKGAKSIVLDLRNNPGGLLDAAIDVTDLLLHEGKLIVYTEGYDASRRTEYVSRKMKLTEDIKILAIVNEGSASAAEILAGAIQDHNLGMVLGQPTFGKGSVQTVIPLKDGSALRLTTAAYFTPNGRNLMDKGIEPDIFVEQIQLDQEKKEEPEAEKKKKELFSRFLDRWIEPDDSEKEVDPDFWENDHQLLTAIRILKGVGVFSGQHTKSDTI